MPASSPAMTSAPLEAKAAQVLVVEDEPQTLSGLLAMLDCAKVSYDLVSTFEDAMREYQLGQHLLVLLDLGLPDAGLVRPGSKAKKDRLTPWRVFRNWYPDPTVWVVTQLYIDNQLLDEVRAAGDRVIAKDTLDPGQLRSDIVAQVNRCSRLREGQTENGKELSIARETAMLQEVVAKLKASIAPLEVHYAKR